MSIISPIEIRAAAINDHKISRETLRKCPRKVFFRGHLDPHRVVCDRIDTGRALTLHHKRNSFHNLHGVHNLAGDILISVKSNQFHLVRSGRGEQRKLISCRIVRDVDHVVAVTFSRRSSHHLRLCPSGRSNPQLQCRVTDRVSVVRKCGDRDLCCLSGGKHTLLIVDRKDAPEKIKFIHIGFPSFFDLNTENVLSGAQFARGAFECERPLIVLLV